LNAAGGHWERLVKKHDADAKQIAALVNPRRAEIFQVLAACGPLSVIELANNLSLRPTALYHHLDVLVSAGVLSTIDGRASGKGRPAVLYEACKVLQFIQALGETRTRRSVEKIVSASANKAARDLNAALAGKKVLSGSQKNVAFFRALFAPSKKNLARVNALLDELQDMALASPKASKDELLAITWFVSPPQRRRN
jgi:predicted ArsR family transcriptional regulator